MVVNKGDWLNDGSHEDDHFLSPEMFSFLQTNGFDGEALVFSSPTNKVIQYNIYLTQQLVKYYPSTQLKAFGYEFVFVTHNTYNFIHRMNMFTFYD